MKVQQSMSASRENPGSRARALVLVLLFVVTVAGAFVGARWAWYRRGHVVVDNALVKGTIAKLGARLDGQVKTVLVEAGQRVSKGQLLVQLEDQHLQATLLQAQAEFAARTNELQSETLAIEYERRRLPLEVERARSLVEAAAAALEGAQSQADRFTSEHARILELTKQQLAPPSELDLITGEWGKAVADVKSATGLRDAAEHARETARLQLEALKVRESRLGELRAQVALAQARVALAQADLNAASLRAPEDGWVVERIVEVGGSAKVGEPMLSLWLGPPWVEAWPIETHLKYLHVGSDVEVSIDAFPDHTFHGHIEGFGLLTDRELISPSVPSTLDSLVRKSARVRVRIALDEQHDRLQPGLSAVVGIRKPAWAELAESGRPSGHFRAAVAPPVSDGLIARRALPAGP